MRLILTESELRENFLQYLIFMKLWKYINTVIQMTAYPLQKARSPSILSLVLH